MTYCVHCKGRTDQSPELPEEYRCMCVEAACGHLLNIGLGDVFPCETCEQCSECCSCP